MQVILLERIGRLGQMGDVVTVKDGFARNFLLPQGKALRATEAQPLVAQPAMEPAPQSAAAAAEPAEPRTIGQTAAAPAATPPAAPIEAKPAPQILPTQDLPEAQGLE